MDQKLTEEQQRSAHKIIKANRGNCFKNSNYLNCCDCPNFFDTCGLSSSIEFQAENLRRSQAWLDEHITDAEIMAESPREFCERMVRTEGKGKCKGMTISAYTGTCKNCVLFINKICSEKLNLIRAQAYLASHPATPQEPPKRRPTPEEMVVGAPVRVRLWDELVRDGKLSDRGHIQFPTIYFNKEMRQYCGNAYKVIKGGCYPHLDGCGDWTFIPEMLDYVEPERVVKPEPVANAPAPEAKEKGNTTVKGDVDKLPLGLLRIINFRDILPTDALRIIALEGQVDDLTKKLAASKKLCDRLHRRLRANWEAKRDGEMATDEEIEAWWSAGKGGAINRNGISTIRPKGSFDWIPATRGNLKL